MHLRMAAGIIFSFRGRNIFPFGALAYQRVREYFFANSIEKYTFAFKAHSYLL